MRRLLTPFAALFAGLVIACAVAGTAGAYSTSPVLDETASWLALRPVEIRCQTIAEDTTGLPARWATAAYVDTIDDRPADYAVFGRDVCEQLIALSTNTWQKRYTPQQLGWAVLVLGHESYHLRGRPGWRNEARATRYGLARARSVALRLGASNAFAWTLRSWAQWWCWQLPLHYRAKGCELSPRQPPVVLAP